jgi:hypothetical protein
MMRKEQPDNLSAFILLAGGFSAQNFAQARACARLILCHNFI